LVSRFGSVIAVVRVPAGSLSRKVSIAPNCSTTYQRWSSVGCCFRSIANGNASPLNAGASATTGGAS
jgi:acetyl-CoA acetyltransferase